MTTALAIDLFCGLGGWAEGLLAEGYDVVGFDIERHDYGRGAYPGRLVIQDVLTLHGSQFHNADLIVASPPCQEYSYMAMPWTLAKAKAKAIRADTTGKMLADLNRLFDACFRIQKEASVAAGRHIPMVVENVRGAQSWVGRARWNYGSYYLWGDVPALMPWTKGVNVPGFRFDGNGSFQSASVKLHGGKDPVHGWSGFADNGEVSWRNRQDVIGHKMARQWWSNGEDTLSAKTWSNSPRRKEASAMIAKIPLPLARHIARTYAQ